MCGIYGFFGKPKEGKEKKVAELMRQLVIETRVRGTHSCGFFAVNKTNTFYNKWAIDPKEFVKKTGNKIDEMICDKGAYLFMGHNRWASIGAITTVNAQPHVGEKFALVHNGTCREMMDKVDSAKIEMKGGSDSEAILRWFDKYGLSRRLLKRTLHDYALCIYHNEEDEFYFTRDPNKPLVIINLRKQLGIRVFCSTYTIAKAAMEICGINPEVKWFYFRPGSLYRSNWRKKEIDNIEQYRKFKPPKKVVTGNKPTTYEPIVEFKNKFEPRFILRKPAWQRAMAVYGD